MHQRGIFYGWVIVAVSFVTLALAFVVWNAFSVFLVAISTDLGWSRAEVSLAFSAFTTVYGLSAPFTGAAIDRFGPRVVMPIGAILLSAGLFGASRTTELWHLFFAYGLLAAVGVSAIGTAVNTAVLANWFSRRRGTAIGLASAGIGVGTAVLVPTSQYIIGVAGWRAAYVFLAVLVVVIVPPLTFAFQRHRPEDMGLLPDGGPAGEAKGRPAPQLVVVDRQWAARIWTVKAAVGTKRFWWLFAGLFFGTLCHQSLMIHQVAYLRDRGFDAMVAASAVGLVGLSGSIGKVGWGWVSDRLGREAAYALGMLWVVGGILLLGFIATGDQQALLYVYAITFGVGYGVYSPLASAASADLFQGRRYGAIYGLLWVGSAGGSSIGPWLSGLLYDSTGTYLPSLGMSFVAAFLSIGAFWLSSPGKVRQVPGIAARALRSTTKRRSA
ncbi:MAG: MFS transporter [Chloroflexota bacterium]